jgi:adenylate cyclase
VLAARTISGETLDQFDEGLRSEGIGDGFRIGVGLNSGPVMAGKVRSERRRGLRAFLTQGLDPR